MNFIHIALLLGLLGPVLTEKVVIIGAGASGLAAAARLIESGYRDVIVFEAEDRIGGRVKSVSRQNHVFEHGAGALWGNESNVLYKFATENRVSTTTREHSYFFVTGDGAALSTDDVVEYVGRFLDVVHNLNVSNDLVSEIFEKELIHEGANKELLRVFYKHVAEVIMPVSDWSNEVGTELWLHEALQDIDVSVDQGMASLLDSLKNHLTRNSNVNWNNILKLQKEVQNLEWNKPKPLVRYKNLLSGAIETIQADKVICTVPLGVLKETHTTLFSPSLPQKNSRAIQQLQVSTINKIFLTFEQPWWPNSASLHVLWTSVAASKLKASEAWVKNIYGFYVLEKNPNTLIAWVIDGDSALSENISNFSPLIDHLKQAFASHGWNVTQPTEVVATKWYQNPHFRGSVSYRGARAHRQGIANADLQAPLVNSQGKKTVFFAGEATHAVQYGTLHGAWESGVRAANEILAENII